MNFGSDWRSLRLAMRRAILMRRRVMSRCACACDAASSAGG